MEIKLEVHGQAGLECMLMIRGRVRICSSETKLKQTDGILDAVHKRICAKSVVPYIHQKGLDQTGSVNKDFASNSIMKQTSVL